MRAVVTASPATGRLRCPSLPGAHLDFPSERPFSPRCPRSDRVHPTSSLSKSARTSPRLVPVLHPVFHLCNPVVLTQQASFSRCGTSHNKNQTKNLLTKPRSYRKQGCSPSFLCKSSGCDQTGFVFLLDQQVTQTLYYLLPLNLTQMLLIVTPGKPDSCLCSYTLFCRTFATETPPAKTQRPWIYREQGHLTY